MGYSNTGKGYTKLENSPTLPSELMIAIDTFMHHINFESGTSEDCLRSEIDFWLKDAKPKLKDEDYEKLKDYYVHGGIYDRIGYPWKNKE